MKGKYTRQKSKDLIQNPATATHRFKKGGGEGYATHDCYATRHRNTNTAYIV